MPHLACLCVTEGREPISQIGYQSWLAAAEFYPKGDVSLHLGIPGGEVPECLLGRNGQVVLYPDCPKSVPERLHYISEAIFALVKDAIVLMWDDDDYSPPHRLPLTQFTFEQYCLLGERPLVASYDRGYFVNLRTLHGHLSTETGTYQDGNIWGGTLSFNQLAFVAAGGFRGKPWPGYDAKFVQDAYTARSWVNILRPLGDHRRPVAFSHGKNVCTWMREPGQDMQAELEAWMPARVWAAVETASRFLVEHRVFPPWSM